jgi:CBS domain-containing protein
MMNSERFLSAFSSIEKALRERAAGDRWSPFYSVVDLLSQGDVGVRHYRDDLKEFADLRNAIVHERTDGHPIAEPNDRAVADIERLARLILSPPTLLPAFQREVQTVGAEEPVGKALLLIGARGFSQVPVLDGAKIVGMVNGTTVVRWLGARVKDDLVSLFDTTVAEVLSHSKYANHRIVGRQTPLVDVVDAFRQFEKQGRPLDAVLISHDGRDTSALLGIVTIHDVPRLVQEIALHPLE